MTLLTKQVKTTSNAIFLIFENLQVFMEIFRGYHLIIENNPNITFMVIHIIYLFLH